MSVVNGQIANQTTFNTAFMSRTASTTSTVAKVAFQNADVESGAFVTNIQRAVNKAFEGVGSTGEADTAINNYANQNYIANGDNRKVAVGKLDAQLKTTQTDLDTAEAEIVVHEGRLDAHDVTLADHETRITTAEATLVDHEGRISTAETTLSNHESRITDIESNTMTIGGNKTFSGDVVVSGNFEVQGTVTNINSTNTNIEDALVTYNKGGTDGSANGAGFEVERPSGNGQVLFDSSLTSKWKVGVVDALYEIVVSGIAQTISGLKNFTSGIKTDTIVESTTNAGVTIASVLLKSGLVSGRNVATDGSTLDGHIANTSNPHSTTASQVGLGSVTNDAQLKRAANDFSSFTQKTTPVGTDIFLLEDSAASGAKKYATLSAMVAGGGGGSGANTALSNLLATSINTSLLPDGDATRNLGAAGFRWGVARINQVITSFLTDSSGADVINLGSRVLLDSSGNTRFQWDSTNLYFYRPLKNFHLAVETLATSTTVGSGTGLVFASAASANNVLTLPTAANFTGQYITFKRTDSTAFAVVITPQVSQTIDGASTKSLTSQYQTMTIASNGSNWFIV